MATLPITQPIIALMNERQRAESGAVRLEEVGAPLPVSFIYGKSS